MASPARTTSSPVRRGRSPGPTPTEADTNSGIMSRWLPYVQIPKSLGSLLIPRSFSSLSSNTTNTSPNPRPRSQSRSVLTPSSVLLAASTHQRMDPSLLVQTAIKRITSSCRQLLLGVLDLSEVTDEHVSLLYTAVVREFFHTMSVLEANHIDITDLNSFPEDLRASLDDLFESSGGASTAATASRPESPELMGRPAAAGANHRLSIMSTSEAAQNDAASESVNSLIHHLIRSLQLKHRQFLAQLASPSPSSSSSSVVSPTSPSTTAASYARLLNPPASVPSPPSTPTPSSTLIHKLYLQLDSTVQREKLDPPVPPSSLTLPTLHALFIRRFHTSLPPLPPSASDFPFKVYLQDPATRTFFELEDPTTDGISDGSLLKLVTAVGTPPVSRPVSVASRHSFASTGEADAATAAATAAAAAGKARVHARALRDMRRDLAALRGDVADAREVFASTLASAREGLHALLASSSSSPMAAQDAARDEAGIPRALIATTRPVLSHLTSQLDARTTDLWELVEQARLDMLHHASIPSRATLDYAASEMEALMRLASEMAARVDVAAPAWKSIWERELARVVEEQEALARVEGVLEVSGKSVERIAKVLVQLRRVSELAEERGQGGVLPARAPVQVGAADEDEWAHTVQGVLEEIQLVSVDHARRMKAVERTERVRQWARAQGSGEPDTPLAKELVHKARSKSRDTRRRTVAIEEVERERERRNREVLRALQDGQQVNDGVARTAE